MLRTHPNHPYMALSPQDAARSSATPALRQAGTRPFFLTIPTQTLAQWF